MSVGVFAGILHAYKVIGTAGRCVLDVIVPRGCAGCDVPDTVLCERCRGLFRHCRRFPCEETTVGFWYACGRYEGRARHAILAWKDHGDEQCDNPFADAMADMIMRCDLLNGRDDVLIVPAPSSKRSLHERGRAHMSSLSKQVAIRIRSNGGNVHAKNVLLVRDMRTKSVQTANARQRASRVAGHIAVRDDADLAGAPVLLIDDIVTTGATMRQCVAALQHVGAEVLSMCALAYTPSAESITTPQTRIP